MITLAPRGQRRRTVPLAPSVLLAAALWVLVAAGARAQSFSVLAGALIGMRVQLRASAVSAIPRR